MKSSVNEIQEKSCALFYLLNISQVDLFDNEGRLLFLMVTIAIKQNLKFSIIQGLAHRLVGGLKQVLPFPSRCLWVGARLAQQTVWAEESWGCWGGGTPIPCAGGQ